MFNEKLGQLLENEETETQVIAEYNNQVVGLEKLKMQKMDKGNYKKFLKAKKYKNTSFN